ncbi:MAG: ATP-binding cassette domain-containing protein, partial [Rhodoferax sp.]|nr:ATP-binding cassette domain-containing protein [Rhodoferax sp.]
MLQIEALAKSYDGTPVFAGVTLALQRGEFVAMLGESGVGKSTLLNCIAGLDRPDRGRIVLDGEELGALDDDASARLRRTRLGFVFQAFHVLPHLTVAENVELPLRLLGRPDAARVQALLEAVGIGALGARAPAQLSGGQLQRVAIARAVVHRPALILADEP